MKTTSFEEIESKVDSLLKELGIQKPAVNPSAIARHLGLDVIYQDMNSDGISGLLAIKGGRSVIAVNKDDRSRRQNFTIAHELGHYMLHYSPEELFVDYGSKNGLTVFYRANLSNREETEANVFAANLMMPKFMVESKIKESDQAYLSEEFVSDIAEEFQVSQLAMTYRLQNLGLL
ncbi:ImmA/IrrE family metallo-endopeptidase [Ekhidna sp.]|uniref:ImmA/IrrE family metallo-endopeptidase n=1 Tax=Ekhidna sp. TaxID=2608089 RepID=UPI003296FE8B